MTERKAIIYGYMNFPRGGATANYVQNFAKGLLEAGYTKVIVVSNKNERLCQNDIEINDYSCNGIEIEYIELASDKINHYLDFNYKRGLMYLKKIKKYCLGKEDLIISYCSDITEVLPVLIYAKRNAIKTGCVIVEWFGPEQFKSKFQYSRYIYSLKFMIKKHEVIFPISNYIKQRCGDKPCLIIPCLVDTEELICNQKKNWDKIKFIYSANGNIKDSLKSMLCAFTYLNDFEMSKVELHLTGAVTREMIIAMNIDGIEAILDNVIVLHEWMEYSQLMQLYERMNCLLLMRDSSDMCKANFPSKVPECMSFGVIPVVSRVGDYTEHYLKHGVDSIIVDGCDANSCLNAIKQIINDDAANLQSMTINSRVTSMERFDYRKWSVKLRIFLNINEKL